MEVQGETKNAKKNSGWYEGKPLERRDLRMFSKIYGEMHK